MILPTSYLGPIQEYVLHAKNEEVTIESYEHFVKQSYRNRCVIYGANGPLKLVVPLKSNKRERTIIKDIKISNDENWQALHWKSISTAYRSSPYFEYYEEGFTKFYLQPQEFLFDFNNQLREFLFEKLNINTQISFTEEFKKEYNEQDLRASLHPKKENGFTPKRYIQVFEERYGFLPNLSVIDLLFNEGPMAKTYLLNQEL